MDQFTADPTARVFEGKIYVYPSHDIQEPPGYKGRPNWFVMEDYHVFSSENLTDWKDHGVIVTRDGVEWADPNAYAMWAPDCVFKDGKYYFYFPAMAKRRRVPHRRGGRGQTLRTVQAHGHSHRRREGNRSRRAHRQGWQRLPVLRRETDLRRQAEAEHAGDRGRAQGRRQSAHEGTHRGAVRVRTQWHLLPHLSARGEQDRAARIRDEHVADGAVQASRRDSRRIGRAAAGPSTIRFSSTRGSGISSTTTGISHPRSTSTARSVRTSCSSTPTARSRKSFRRCAVSDSWRRRARFRSTATVRQAATRIAVSFLDDANPHAGWKTTFSGAKSWVRFNEVDFGRGAQKSIEVRARAPGKGELEIRLDNPDGPLLGQRESRPGTRLENCERCREEDSRRRPRSRRYSGRQPNPSKWIGSVSAE